MKLSLIEKIKFKKLKQQEKQKQKFVKVLKKINKYDINKNDRTILI